MKYLCVALCFVAAIALIDAFPGFGGCDTTDDCGDGKCCVRVGGPFFRMTKCKSLPKEGKECIPQASKNGVYDFKCPCQEGLECVGEEKVKPTKSGSDSSSSSSESEENLKYKCRATATSGAPDVSSHEPEPEPSREPEPEPSHEPEPEPSHEPEPEPSHEPEEEQ